MHWIVDSGGTKAAWVNEAKQVFDFQGINPNVQKSDVILELLKKVKSELNLSASDSVIWYGAGCSNAIAKEKLTLAFKSIGMFNVDVNHDLLAAARAVLGDKKGIVGILGTGSNACFYNGKNVVSEKISLGYIMGDEGGASYFGRRLFKDYVDNTMPVTEANIFENTYGSDKQNLIAQFYASTAPSAHLGAFAKILDSFGNDSVYRNNLLNIGFNDYFKLFVKPLVAGDEKLPIGFVGSVAHIYQSVLKEKAADINLDFIGVERNPILALVDWHLINK